MTSRVKTWKPNLLSHGLSALLIMTTTVQAASPAMAQDQQSRSTSSSGYTGQGTPLTSQELDSLVSPIALYPDSLVAQILAASTFPDQIAVASYWVQQNKSLTGNALMQAVNKQSWDPSVKALTQFPSVLNNMAQNISWTSQLGDAYHNQQSDVMAAIQALREQAKTAGNLKSTPQQTVSTESQSGKQVIVIQPANTQVVYVPTYNPTVIYGTPYYPPGYSAADVVVTGLLSFGAGIAVGAMMNGRCCGWGWSSWSCNWYHGAAYYGYHPYYGNAAWHGGYYGGYNNYGYHPYNSSYHSNYNTGYQHYGDTSYNRNTNVSGNTVNVNRGDSSASDSWDKSGWSNSDAARGWGSNSDTSARSTAFSGYGDHSGSSSGSGGWADRSSSSRGWASRGGGGGWGGGHFSGGGSRGGGGFRR